MDMMKFETAKNYQCKINFLKSFKRKFLLRISETRKEQEIISESVCDEEGVLCNLNLNSMVEKIMDIVEKDVRKEILKLEKSFEEL